jgi:hypothetical protein
MTRNYYSALRVTRAFRLKGGLVLATLRNAMPVLGEALILLAIPAAGRYEAQKNALAGRIANKQDQ